MKLYIPTCTLNFNNIFSTESISPAAFYAKRDFGNKRYYKVEANELDNVLILYSKYPHFHVSNTDIENSPLVIEIETDDYPTNQFQKVNSIDEVDIFVTNTTVYLNPFHTKAYFQSYQDLQATLTKADQSLDNKYSKLYKPSYLVHQEKNWSLTSLFSSNDSFEWNPSFNTGASEIPLQWTEEDSVIDRLKGAIVCYIIGTNMSVSKEVGRLKQLGRKMRNTLSAIVNTPNKRPTDLQDETLLSYIEEFNEIYSNLDENSLFNKAITEQKLKSPSTGLDKQRLLMVLKDLHLEEAFKRQLNLRPVYNPMELYTCLDATTMSTSDAYNVVVDRLFDAIKRIETKERSKAPKKPIADLINIENGVIHITDPLAGEGTFISKIINTLVKREYKAFMIENGTEELLSIAFVGGGKLKEFMPEKWEGSEYQTYINGLLANLQQGVSFDLFSIDNEILQSFAAFCQKGEEVDRLTDYMLQCGFSDYRFALGIFGATRGFASLPKTFTSSLIDGDKPYYIECYKVLHKWLHGIDIENIESIPHDSDDYLKGLDTPLSSMIIESINRIEPSLGKQEAIVRAISQTASLEDAIQNPKAFMYILDSFPRIKSTIAYKNLEKADFANDISIYGPKEFKEKIYRIVGKEGLKSQKEKIDKAIELEAKRQDPEAFLKILDNFLNPKDSAYKRIASILNKGFQNKTSNEEMTLFSEQTVLQTTRTYHVPSLFINDDNCWDYLMTLFPEKHHQQAHRDLKWFQDEFRKGEKSQYYARSNKDNNTAIAAFIKFLGKRTYASSLDIQKIADYLRQIYVR